MKTLKEIKQYLNNLQTNEVIKSVRGNSYNVKKVDNKTMNKLKKFKSIYINPHKVNNKLIYNVSYVENKNVFQMWLEY